MPTQIAISIASIPAQRFNVSVRENASEDPKYLCPGKPPKWISDLLSTGARMSLPTLIFQAGRHFSDRICTSVVVGSSSKRSKAKALAWALISMIDPYIENDLLWVRDPKDPDIKRLCSEILGVGAGLQVLISRGVVDGRTIRKRSKRFDFDANSPGGVARVFIEAKGTFDGVSGSGHRISFKSKLNTPGIITTKNPRGYGRAVGIVFSTWSKKVPRRPDVELLDPEQDAEDTFHETVREVIRFYARALDELIGKEQGAQLLYTIAGSDRLFDSDYPLPIDLGATGRFPIEIHRATVRLSILDRKRTFLGAFWESRIVPPILKEIIAEEYQFAYTGIDQFVYEAIHDRKFRELLTFQEVEDQIFKVVQNDFRAHFLLDRYGILRAWMNRVPEEIDILVRVHGTL